jgi:SAM-dependent methyltransferase
MNERTSPPLIRDRVCPVCRQRFDALPFTLPTSRGERQWARCACCRSYFDCEPFELEKEVSHTRLRPWGNIELGVEVGDNKRDMYISVLRLLSRYAEPRSKLLDVGCSTGGFLEAAGRQNFLGQGMDIVPETVEYCRERGLSCQTGASVGDLDLADSSLDIVSVLDCNYYWADQVRELRAIWTKLRPDGLLVMRVVDKSWMIAPARALCRIMPRLGKKMCRRAVNDHRVSIPVRSLLRILRREGFAILYASPAGASQGSHSSFGVRASFAFGYLAWLAARRYWAPGCLVLARKQDQ